MTHPIRLRFALVLISLVLLFTLAPSVGASPPRSNGYLTNCTGEYFNNITLSGGPALTRADPTLNFFWPEWTSPAPGINVNNYSVRWTFSINVASGGDYTFNLLTDDGMNLLIDNNLVLCAWYDHGPSPYWKTINLSAGWHTVRVEYYNRTLGGTAQVSWSGGGGGGTFPDWRGEYYNNPSLSGAPVITRNDPNINFNWGTGSPDPSIPPAYFSVRWTRTFYFNGGTWRFTTTTKDGVRLWVDSNLLIDKWFNQSASYSADIALAAGNHTVRMEYYNNSSYAIAQLSYTPVSPVPPPPPPPPPPTTAWRGYYYYNVTLTDPAVCVRDDPAINFNWGTGSPCPGIWGAPFSVRWDSTQNLSVTGNYTIVATSDDGVRVWVDGGLVIDAWYDHVPMTFSAVRYLAAGAHSFRVEYYERGGGALIVVQITSGSVPPPPPPPPVGDVIVDDRGPGWQAGGSSSGWHDAPVGIGGHSFWTFNNAYAAPYYNWARWYPTLPAPGNYEVFAYIPAGIATTTNARYWIYHAGRHDLAARSQCFYADQWLSLGTYYFNALGGENVSLSDVTYECYLCRTLVFDAIKFSPR